MCPQCAINNNKNNNKKKNNNNNNKTYNKNINNNSLTVKSGARLPGWLACDGFQTLLVLIILSAG